jgi:hypothetical protein
VFEFESHNPSFLHELIEGFYVENKTLG